MRHTSTTSPSAQAIAEAGWFVTPPILPSREVDRLIDALTPRHSSLDGRGGIRNLFSVPEVRAIARSTSVRGVAEAILGANCFAVKATLFDKTPQANWKVSWHQDVTIAVQECRDVAEFGPWSEKDGTPHVQAPASVLERMLAVRIHLDDCGPENGPVRVIPGSHRSGRLDRTAIEAWLCNTIPVSCVAPRGAILAFQPLLLHASSPASEPGHRRVVHLEFAASSLDNGLLWANEI